MFCSNVPVAPNVSVLAPKTACTFPVELEPFELPPLLELLFELLLFDGVFVGVAVGSAGVFVGSCVGVGVSPTITSHVP